MRVICMLTILMLLFVLASCSGTGETGLSYEQFRQKVESLDTKDPTIGKSLRPIAKYKEILGQPEKEQAFEDQYFLYYRVREGRAQVILGGDPSMGYVVAEINLL